MRLSLDKRARVIAIFLNYKLDFLPKRFERLKELAANKDIVASTKTISKLVKNWFINGIYCFKLLISLFLIALNLYSHRQFLP